MHEPFIRDLAFKIVDGQRLDMEIDIAAYYLARAIHDEDGFIGSGDYVRPTPRQVRAGVEAMRRASDAGMVERGNAHLEHFRESVTGGR